MLDGWVVFYEHGYMGYATYGRYGWYVLYYALARAHPSWKNRVDRGAATQKLHDPGKVIPSEADHPLLSVPVAPVAPSSNAPSLRSEPRQPTTRQRDSGMEDGQRGGRRSDAGAWTDGVEPTHRIDAVTMRSSLYSGAVASARGSSTLFPVVALRVPVTFTGNVGV